MPVQRAVHSAGLKGMGAAIGRPTVIAPELREGALVPVFEFYREVRSSSCVIATSTARRKPEVQVFREWLLEMADDERWAKRLPGTVKSGGRRHEKLGAWRCLEVDPVVLRRGTRSA